MYKKRSKKGLSQVDWAMSLSIFLLYLAWFFVFLKPMIAPPSDMNTLLDILETGYKNEVEVEIQNTRIHIPNQIQDDSVPIVIPFTESWDESDISITSDYFAIDNNKLFFIANLSQNSFFNIYYPHNALEFSYPKILISDFEYSRFKDFLASFDDGVLTSIIYDGKERVKDINIEYDDTEFVGDFYYKNNSVFAQYNVQGDVVNLSTYFFAGNSDLHLYFEPSDNNNHSMEIEFATYNYTDFYFDPTSFGELTYTLGPNCRYYTSDFLNLYDLNSGLLITADKNITFRLCTNSTTPKITLTFDLFEETGIYFMSHKKTVDQIKNYPITPIVGMTNKFKSFTIDGINSLNGKDPEYLKVLFDFPKDRDFNILIRSDLVNSSIGITQPDLQDIFARKVESVILDTNFTQKRVYAILSVW